MNKKDLTKFAGTIQSDAIVGFVNDLAAAFSNASVSNEFEGINEKSVYDIFQIIKNVLSAKNYGAVTTVQTMEKMKDPAIIIGEGIMALEDDIPKILYEIQNATNPEEKRQLDKELSDIQAKLNALHEKIKHLKEGKRAEDREMFEKLKQYLQSRGRNI